MISLQDYKDSKSVKTLVRKLFESRQVAHNVHLQTKSYSLHKALNSFYDDILDHADTFIETYQGQYGILTGYEKLDITPLDESKIEDYFPPVQKKIDPNNFVSNFNEKLKKAEHAKGKEGRRARLAMLLEKMHK